MHIIKREPIGLQMSNVIGSGIFWHIFVSFWRHAYVNVKMCLTKQSEVYLGVTSSAVIDGSARFSENCRLQYFNLGISIMVLGTYFIEKWKRRFFKSEIELSTLSIWVFICSFERISWMRFYTELESYNRLF